ncbi:MAG: hypothetical protein V4584_12335 [Verrucomicrobiota bacterium]
MNTFIRLIAGPAMTASALAGPFPPAAGVAGSDAIITSDPRFSFWASGVEVTRGPVEIEFPDDSLVTYGSESDALGPADATPDEPYPVVSLGDGGRAVLTFSTPFGDVPGPDFAVFENGFIPNFLELAHVEVSSDGVNFFRFPSTSLTPVTQNLGEGGAVDPTNVRNLAGKYLAGYGTPFDLAELRRLYPALDVQRIIKVRIIDVVGTNVPSLGSLDSLGQIITDPYPTPFPSGGFDLDAVGVFKATATTYATWTANQGLINANAAATADPDQNGVQNLIEYLTGNGVVGMATGTSGRTLHFSRLSYRTGGNLRIQGSSDLAHWTTLATSANAAAMQSANTGAATVSEAGSANSRKEVSVQLPSNSPYRYFRLAAELVP